MPWLKPTETQAHLLIGALKGARPGGLAGGAATVLSGVAVTTTTPAWLPVIGGAAVVSVATVVTGTAIVPGWVRSAAPWRHT